MSIVAEKHAEKNLRNERAYCTALGRRFLRNPMETSSRPLARFGLEQQSNEWIERARHLRIAKENVLNHAREVLQAALVHKERGRWIRCIARTTWWLKVLRDHKLRHASPEFCGAQSRQQSIECQAERKGLF